MSSGEQTAHCLVDSNSFHFELDFIRVYSWWYESNPNNKFVMRSDGQQYGSNSWVRMLGTPVSGNWRRSIPVHSWFNCMDPAKENVSSPRKGKLLTQKLIS